MRTFVKTRARALRVGKFAAFLLLISFATEARAYAYTDPGSGALIWQMIAASLLAVPFYFRRVIEWVKKKVNRQ